MPEEATTAGLKARELIDKYHLTLTELEVRGEPLVTEETQVRPGSVNGVAHL